jgi:hypothetical protein
MVYRFKGDQKDKTCITNIAFYGIIIHYSPTLAIMVSLSTSLFMSTIKERKVTLNPDSYPRPSRLYRDRLTSGRAEPFSSVNGYNF